MKEVIQFAIVTPNADETVKLISETLNLGPLKVWDFKHPQIFDTTINNEPKPWTMKLAFGWIGNMQFEVIEPTQGQSLYKNYLDKYTNAGIQHLLLDRRKVSYPDMKQQFVEIGMPIVNEAKSNIAVKIGPFTVPPLPMFLAKSMSTVFGYADTLDTLKTVIEISKYPPGIEPRKGIRMGVPSYWSNGNKDNFEELPSNSLIIDIEGFIVLVKKIDEVKQHYQKLFGKPSNETLYELMYQSEKGFIKVVQPADEDSAYSNILNKKGEGVRILVATPRAKAKAKNDEDFKAKNFEINNLIEKETLYTHNNLPFQIQINL
jgi:hypothetical protein